MEVLLCASKRKSFRNGGEEGSPEEGGAIGWTGKQDEIPFLSVSQGKGLVFRGGARTKKRWGRTMRGNSIQKKSSSAVHKRKRDFSKT